jgi:N-acetylglutamate synthase-like GNAT family acetyltransferase
MGTVHWTVTVIHIRRAGSPDIGGTADVVKAVWDQDVLPDVVRAQIEDDASALWVAERNDDVLGFVSAFLTIAGDGRRRWEVDLIAVRPASQGQGLGTRLIRRVCKTGQARAASLTRALIRVENVPSHRAFEAAGFTTDSRDHELLLWPPQTAGDPRPYAGPVDLLLVDTLTYRGLWMEGLTSVPAEEQRRALEAARSIAASENRANAGAVIPADESHRLAPDLRVKARMHGEYYWFVKKDQNVKHKT